MPSGNPDLSIIPDDVREVGRIAYRIADELQSGAKTLDINVRQFLTSWTGSAADTYSDGWDDVHTGANRVWQELFELAEKLGITADTYQRKDSQTKAAISSLDLP